MIHREENNEKQTGAKYKVSPCKICIKSLHSAVNFDLIRRIKHCDATIDQNANTGYKQKAKLEKLPMNANKFCQIFHCFSSLLSVFSLSIKYVGLRWVADAARSIPMCSCIRRTRKPNLILRFNSLRIRATRVMVNITVSASNKLIGCSSRLPTASALTCKVNVGYRKCDDKNQGKKSHILNCFMQFKSFSLSLHSLLLRLMKLLYRSLFYLQCKYLNLHCIQKLAPETEQEIMNRFIKLFYSRGFGRVLKCRSKS